MPVKRLFSAMTDTDPCLDLQSHDLSSCILYPSNHSNHNISSTIWVADDSNDSGLGSEDIFSDDLSPSPKRQRSTPSSLLPTVPGKHEDLKSITPQTLCDLVSGHYKDMVTSYRIVDCRFPYEFNGGHVKSAENCYTTDLISELLLDQPAVQVLIFHCEFSQERGPNMLRHLRNQDRQLNCENYPTLSYPEVYLVDGGYEAVYRTMTSICSPPSYTPMIHPDHADDLRLYRRTSKSMRHFRTKSKSWSSGDKPTISRKVKL